MNLSVLFAVTNRIIATLPRNLMKFSCLHFAAFTYFGLTVLASLTLAQESSPSQPVYAPPPPPPMPPPAARPLDPLPSESPVPAFVTEARNLHFSPGSIQSVWSSEVQLNQYYNNLFILSSKFGADRMTVPTMDLDPSFRLILHQDLKLDGATFIAMTAYRVDQLELIGIAKHDTPVAFVVNRHSAIFSNSPRGVLMRGYSSFNKPVEISGTRPLSDFEKFALTKLQTGPDVVDQPQPDGSLVVVGAVRAQQACIQCHDTYKVGEPLGAFSYHLGKASLFENIPPSTTRPLDEYMGPRGF